MAPEEGADRTRPTRNAQRLAVLLAAVVFQDNLLRGLSCVSDRYQHEAGGSAAELPTFCLEVLTGYFPRYLDSNPPDQPMKPQIHVAPGLPRIL